MGLTRAQSNRKVRQEALRDQLEAQGHVQYVVETIEKLNDVDNVDLDSLQIQRLGKVIDSRLKLINKYLPDVKEVHNEHSGGIDLGEMSDSAISKRINELLSQRGE